MTSKYIIKDGRVVGAGANDPDVEWFIDGLSAGMSVSEILDAHKEDHPESRVTPEFWRLLVARIWEMLEANGEYDQEMLDAIAKEATSRLQHQLQWWQAAAATYKQALIRASVHVPPLKRRSALPLAADNGEKIEENGD